MHSSYEYLVQEVLYELFLERPRSKETVQVGPQEFRDEIAERVSAIGPHVKVK